MDQIFYYIVEFILVMVIAFPLYGIGRWVYLVGSKKGKEFNRSFEAGLLCFTLYMVFIASQTIVPDLSFEQNHLVLEGIGFDETRINLVPLHKIQETTIMVENNHLSYLFIEVFGNIGVFIPIGFMLPLLWRRFEKGWKAVATCFIMSLSIEVIQLILPRATDIDDVIMNTTGGLMGYFLFFFYKKIVPNISYQFKKEKNV